MLDKTFTTHLQFRNHIKMLAVKRRVLGHGPATRTHAKKPQCGLFVSGKGGGVDPPSPGKRKKGALPSQQQLYA